MTTSILSLFLTILSIITGALQIVALYLFAATAIWLGILCLLARLDDENGDIEDQP